MTALLTSAGFHCPKESIGYLLRRAHKLSTAMADDAFTGEALTFTQWIALVQLREGTVDTCGGLARYLDHDSGATTRMLDQLEARGLVTRTRSATDRRVVNILVTEGGCLAVEALIPRLNALMQEVLVDFAADEVKLLTSLLVRLVNRLDAETAARRLS
jgi:DNA-binding MarR family transcriptional regulator